MKASLYDSTGKKTGEISLPSIFETPIREDLAGKYFEVMRLNARQPYSHAPEAGKRHSASGTISHRRHMWGGHYGKGISRVPRKTMWRRGTQFYWIGAEVNSTRGGRRAHGPMLYRKSKNMNQKEARFALSSAIAATASSNYIKKRYTSLGNLNVSVPLVLSSPQQMKTKAFFSLTKSIFGENVDRIWNSKTVRPGKGKSRGRKYKTQLGMLLIHGIKEKISLKGIDVKSVNEISIGDLYPLGRLTMFTEQAIKEIPERVSKGVMI